ncbi:MAG: UPF0261 family protein [Thiobacillus sp.]|nr:UPF0261 family protein [Thiobacillus sp.]
MSVSKEFNGGNRKPETLVHAAPPAVAVLGSFDTKGGELRYLCHRLKTAGVDVITIDFGVYGPAIDHIDFPAAHVASAGGADLSDLRISGDRGSALSVMASGTAEILRLLMKERRIRGAVSLGGGGGTNVASKAMQSLPIGFPKLIVSTVASGNVRPYVQETDLTLMYSVLDVAGLNRITRAVLNNAASAIAGMASQVSVGADEPTRAPSVALTAFGVTSKGATAARRRLEEHGFEVLVFHATGSGGLSLEKLLRAGFFSGVFDLTTTELADDLVGGVMSAGPDRLTAAAEVGVPQVVSLGALDMVNLGPLADVAPEFRARRLIRHNDMMTLMRTTAAENSELGSRMAAKLNVSTGPAAIFIPLKGVSSVAIAGEPFFDPEADQALFAAIRNGLGPNVKLVERDVDINNTDFVIEAADELAAMIARLPNLEEIEHDYEKK